MSLHTRRSAAHDPLESGGAAVGGGCRLGLGTHSLHRLLAPAARRRLLHAAYDLGVRYFDTAPSYGAGLAERELGGLAHGRRSALVLATKFGIAAGRLATALPASALVTAAAGAALRAIGMRRTGGRGPIRDYRVATMQRSVEESLRRLRTDYLDILYLHAPTVDSLAEADGLADAVQALLQAGKVRRIGLTGEPPDCLAVAQIHPGLGDVIQLVLPADCRGLPSATHLPAGVALGVWEFPAPQGGSKRPALRELLERLHRALPTGLIVLSTPDRPSFAKPPGFSCDDRRSASIMSRASQPEGANPFTMRRLPKTIERSEADGQRQMGAGVS